jgi:hypothetical protein
MLWDWIAYGYQSRNRDPNKNAEDARVQDVMFKALVGLLDSPIEESQAAAIHGLGHLHHRDSNHAITDFLSSDRAITPQVRKYAAEVVEGHFQ